MFDMGVSHAIFLFFLRAWSLQHHFKLGEVLSAYKSEFRTSDILQNICFSTAYHHNSPDRENYSQQTDF